MSSGGYEYRGLLASSWDFMRVYINLAYQEEGSGRMGRLVACRRKGCV